jgi:hypothetical protein
MLLIPKYKTKYLCHPEDSNYVEALPNLDIVQKLLEIKADEAGHEVDLR